MTEGVETADRPLAGRVRRGLVWSTASAVLLRLGSLVVGIALARILSPEDFGVYALALTVQAVLITLADLGLSADLIRSDDPHRMAPTVGALGLVSGGALTLAMMLTAPVVAAALGSPAAAPVIMVLSITLLLAGAGVVPYAFLQRRFDQRRLFFISAADLAVSASVTFAMLASGAGVMSLAIGRISAQAVTLVLQFALARVRPNYRIDRELVKPVLRFGAPVAAANLLSWALLNIDYVAISRIQGATTLGYYVLAFNIASWPMSTIGHVVRSVALPGFAAASRETGQASRTLSNSLALAWLAALPAGALLAALSLPLILVVYGEKWSPSAPVLAALGLFGAMRVVLDICAAYLLARGASSSVLRVQLVWFLALLPAVVIGANTGGAAGVGWAHVAVATVITLPAYLFAVRAEGGEAGEILRGMWPPLVAIVPAAFVAALLAGSIGNPVLAVLAGGAAGMALYALLTLPRAKRVLGNMKRLSQPVEPGRSEPAAGRVEPGADSRGRIRPDARGAPHGGGDESPR